jgi:hypothetical protein
LWINLKILHLASFHGKFSLPKILRFHRLCWREKTMHVLYSKAFDQARLSIRTLYKHAKQPIEAEYKSQIAQTNIALSLQPQKFKQRELL